MFEVLIEFFHDILSHLLSEYATLVVNGQTKRWRRSNIPLKQQWLVSERSKSLIENLLTDTFCHKALNIGLYTTLFIKAIQFLTFSETLGVDTARMPNEANQKFWPSKGLLQSRHKISIINSMNFFNELNHNARSQRIWKAHFDLFREIQFPQTSQVFRTQCIHTLLSNWPRDPQIHI